MNHHQPKGRPLSVDGQLLQDLDVVRVILEKAEVDLALKRGRPARRLRTAAATLSGMADAWDNANRGGSVESDGPPTHAGSDDPAPPHQREHWG